LAEHTGTSGIASVGKCLIACVAADPNHTRTEEKAGGIALPELSSLTEDPSAGENVIIRSGLHGSVSTSAVDPDPATTAPQRPLST
jgi:hypothetical protein